jgi:hypothetical protein
MKVSGILMTLVNKFKKSKGILSYFFITYVDKIISFALPLSILFIIKDKELYSFVEVAFSYATLIMIVLELGVSNYLFFGYKNSEDRELFLMKSIINFKFLLVIYFLFSCLLFVSIKLYDENLLVLFVIVIIRTLFTFYLKFFSNIYRLRDKPAGIYLISIITNAVSFLLLILANYFVWPDKLFYFFLPSLLLIVGVSFNFVFFEFSSFKLNDFKEFLNKSLRYSWPIIINVLAMSYMNNYAKIYAFEHLSQEEMVQISYIMRIGLIIQLTHAAFSSYFSKSIFMDSSSTFNFKFFKQYTVVLIVALMLVTGIMAATNFLFSAQLYIPLITSTFLFLVYILLWCFVGYLEIYFGIKNANRMVLYFSIASSVIYTFMLKFGGEINVFKLSLYMVISAVVNLLLVIFGLYKLKVINLGRHDHKLKDNMNEQ